MSTEYNDEFTVKDFEIGENIELHPATDAWMAGDRFGMVSRIGRKYIYCLMDRSDQTRQMLPKHVGKWHGFGGSTALASDPADVALAEGRPVADFEKELIDNSLATHLKEPKEYFADGPVVKSQPKPTVKRHVPAHEFSVNGQRISTRSSVPWKRKLAKKLALKKGLAV